VDRSDLTKRHIAGPTLHGVPFVGNHGWRPSIEARFFKGTEAIRTPRRDEWTCFSLVGSMGARGQVTESRYRGSTVVATPLGSLDGNGWEADRFEPRDASESFWTRVRPYLDSEARHAAGGNTGRTLRLRRLFRFASARALDIQ